MALVTGLLLSGCAGDDDDPTATDSPAPSAEGSASSTPSATASAPATDVDPASVKANELALVPVMMYHVVKPEAKGEYDQTPTEFKAELERMHEADFVPITVQELVAGDIDVPAGKHPVVLTFDDSSPQQIQIGADGKPTADSAVGILEAFETANPDFRATASFYVNGSPFNDPKAVPWLVENGYEVGLHTVNHINLKQSSDATIQKELTLNSEDIKAAAPDAVVNTISLPFGISPTNKSLIRGGSYEGKSYEIDGALLVGSNPAKSPFNVDFDPYAIARIRSGPKSKPVDTDSTYWLNLLEQGKWTPYTSDGDPEKISYPSTSSVKLGEKWADKGNEYDPDGATGSSGSSSGSTSSPNPSSTTSSTPASTPKSTSSGAPSSTSTP
ncbi:polysaccharide deacetylase family protein [Sporichthya sp.]|uniref:polysaccharide deacetylase family protein n=1 Tax=Sporichthya sp. TaxID=65475 RepID=UPI0017CB591F|nr:polysaccharide deacetylase family protein [Sporichthya sp.]MBA3745186.1 polysaccharide deacetylase family protein [Sporichthya sp.]